MRAALSFFLTGALLGVACEAGAPATHETGESAASTSTGSQDCTASLESVRDDILVPKCGLAGCHSASDAAGGLDLSATADLMAELANISAGTCEGWIRVVPGDPATSFLHHKVAATTPDCGSRMPPGANSLSVSELACVEGWIANLEPSCETCGGEVCIDFESDAAHCGGCNQACPPSVACASGQCDCGPNGEVCAGECVNVQNNPTHCGACENSCEAAQVCLEGACADGCGDLDMCGQSCVDLQSDPQHCGECDNPCADGQMCVAGVCQCGAAPVSFASHIEPMFVASCTGMGCHSGAAPKANLRLTAGSAYDELVDVAADQCAERLLVAPGLVEDSYLIDKLTGVDMCSGSQMPKNDPPWSASDIGLLSDWICQGAPNN